VLYLQGQPIAILAALAIDLGTLNQRLFDIRRRTPRSIVLGCIRH